jgi:peptidoglycan/xylan/chitin deacetylase (PgdA/CDA1 family)
MKLPSHDRFPYSGIVNRPHFTWPDGKRLAVYLAVCVEHFSYDDGGLGLSYSPGLAHPNTYNWAWREYGNRVGGWRLAELAEQFGIPLTVLLNAACYEHCPELVRAMKGSNGEIVAHGMTNSTHPNGMSEAEERATIARVTAAINQNEGSAPLGWMSPGANPSRRTEDLLQEAGYRYTMDWPMDDQPVWMRAGGGHLLGLPYPHEVNDVPMIALHHGTAPAFAQMAIDNFDELLRASAQQSLAYGMTLHTFIVGQPFRLRQFRAVLEHLNAHSQDIWFTTAGAIAGYYAGLFPPPPT